MRISIKLPTVFLCMFLFTGCEQEAQLIGFPSNQPLEGNSDITLDPTITPTDTTPKVAGIAALVIQQISPLAIMEGRSIDLSVVVVDHAGQKSNPFYDSWIAPNGDVLPIIWSSDNPLIAWVDELGTLWGFSTGQTTIRAHLGGYGAGLRVFVVAAGIADAPDSFVPIADEQDGTVEDDIDPVTDGTADDLDEADDTVYQPEPAEDPTDYYLNADDILTMSYGTGAGFGQAAYPEVVYGAPQGSTHVLSFGLGGSLLIELEGYFVVDGPGVDFTVFENPFGTGAGTFAERARVEVSSDGINFIAFSCAVDDQDGGYPGCAGVTPTAMDVDPRDLDESGADESGGDGFDLRLIEVGYARYIRITDLATCQQGDPTFPVCNSPGKVGFDMDALAIINGVNE